jgi:hypothetical protein
VDDKGAKKLWIYVAANEGALDLPVNGDMTAFLLLP